MDKKQIDEFLRGYKMRKGKQIKLNKKRTKKYILSKLDFYDEELAQSKVSDLQNTIKSFKSFWTSLYQNNLLDSDCLKKVQNIYEKYID